MPAATPKRDAVTFWRFVRVCKKRGFGVRKAFLELTGAREGRS